MSNNEALAKLAGGMVWKDEVLVPSKTRRRCSECAARSGNHIYACRLVEFRQKAVEVKGDVCTDHIWLRLKEAP